VERKWHERYPHKFRCRTVERMNACDNIVRLARELHRGHLARIGSRRFPDWAPDRACNVPDSLT
jgi:hypothetical protein